MDDADADGCVYSDDLEGMEAVMTKRVYIVTDGSYSDYRICAVFSNEKDAERYKTLINADNDIEEYDVDPVDLSKHANELYWQVQFLQNGDIRMVSQRGIYDKEFVDESHHGEIEISGSFYREHFIRYYGEPNDMLILLWARNEDAAVKIASEWRTILLGSHPELVDTIRQSRHGKTIKLTGDGIETSDILR